MSRVRVISSQPISVLPQTLNKNPTHVCGNQICVDGSPQQFYLTFEEQTQVYRLQGVQSSLQSLLNISQQQDAGAQRKDLEFVAQSGPDPELWQEGPQILSTQSLPIGKASRLHFKQGDRVLYCDNVRLLDTAQAIYQVTHIRPADRPDADLLVLLSCDKFKDGYYQQEPKVQIGEILLLQLEHNQGPDNSAPVAEEKRHGATRGLERPFQADSFLELFRRECAKATPDARVLREIRLMYESVRGSRAE